MKPRVDSVIETHDAFTIAAHLPLLCRLGYVVECDREEDTKMYKVRVFKAEHDRIVEVGGARDKNLAVAFRMVTGTVIDSIPDEEYNRRLEDSN